MGNENTSNNKFVNNSQKTTQELESQLILISKMEDAAYGEFKLQKNKNTNQLIAQKTYILSNDQDKQLVLQKIKRLKSLQINSIVQLIDVGHDEQSELCTRFLKYNLLFEYYEDNLEKKMKERKQSGQIFTELEICQFINCIVSALTCMQQQKINHGDIRPKTILVGQDNTCKLTDLNTMTNINAYRSFLMGLKEQCYLSPQLVQCLKNREFNPQHSIEKSDVFSLGMICLELSTLQNINTCYDFQQFLVKVDRIQQFIDDAQNKYSQDFCSLLCNMLELKEQQRFGFFQIAEYLTYLFEKSNNTQNFQSNQSNQKEIDIPKNQDNNNSNLKSIINDENELNKNKYNEKEEEYPNSEQKQQQQQSIDQNQQQQQSIHSNQQQQLQDEELDLQKSYQQSNAKSQQSNADQNYLQYYQKQQQQSKMNSYQVNDFDQQQLSPQNENDLLQKNVYQQLQNLQQKVDFALQNSSSIKQQFNTLSINNQEIVSSDDEQEIQRAIEKKKLKKNNQIIKFNNKKNNFAQLKDISNTQNQSQVYQYSNRKNNDYVLSQQKNFQDEAGEELQQENNDYQQNQIEKNINKDEDEEATSLYDLYLKEYEKIMKEQMNQLQQ